jgi:hypothetical protein
MAERLTALDATFLELEDLDDGALMSIGGTMVFDPLPAGAPTLDELRARLSARLAALPRYTQRLSSPHVPAWSWPQWVEDEGSYVKFEVLRVQSLRRQECADRQPVGC